MKCKNVLLCYDVMRVIVRNECFQRHNRSGQHKIKYCNLCAGYQPVSKMQQGVEEQVLKGVKKTILVLSGGT